MPWPLEMYKYTQKAYEVLKREKKIPVTVNENLGINSPATWNALESDLFEIYHYSKKYTCINTGTCHFMVYFPKLLCTVCRNGKHLGSCSW